jgi:hypothetical protein
LAFFHDDAEEVVAELAKVDLDAYTPGGAVEALAPKSRFGFRIVHQIAAVDTLLFLASVTEIGSRIELRRQSRDGLESFSYRFEVSDSGQLFASDRTYKDWLHSQYQHVKNNINISSIVLTDISDFYARINFHRIENLLDECAPNDGAVRFIKKQIRIIRAKQSFGLPVGGSAARLLAELALSDTDRALSDQGIIATRFVDDFRIFLGPQENPYDVLGFLAEQLGINEGLSLNVAKTSVSSRTNFLERLEEGTTDVAEEAEFRALEKLTAELYFDEEPDEEDVQKLRNLNLLELLEKEIMTEEWDVGKIKVLFRALKITRPTEAIEQINVNFKEIVIFAKDVCLLMHEIAKEHPSCFDSLLDEVIEAILSPPASSVQVIRTWLLEIFVRGIVDIPLSKLRRLENLPSLLDKRQLILIRGRCGDKNFFRKQKTAIHQFSSLEQSCLIWGASCLPDDEYEKWIATLRPNFVKPTGTLFLKWAETQKTKLISRLAVGTEDHPD